MTKRFEGKVAIVTGASAGMGLSAALRLAEEGSKVVLAARTQSKLDAAVEKIKASGGEAIGVVTDVSSEADNKKLVDTAVEKYGKLDVAFVNAGTYGGAPVAEITEEVVDQLLGTNVKSVIFALKYMLPAIEAGGGSGSILVNSSCMGSHATANAAVKGAGVYAASKAAADMIVKYAAVEAAAHKSRVNAIAPGVVRTSIFGEGAPDSAYEEFAAPLQLVGRAGTPEEISSFVAYLLSDEASFVTGAVLIADGGWALKA